jgi:predicted amidohydrolase
VSEIASRITVSQVRAEPLKSDVDANCDTLLGLLAAIEPGTCDVIVTPECFLDGYMANQPPVTPAELVRCAVDPASDLRVKRIAAEARRLRAWLVLGCTRRAGDDLFNTALLLDRSGSLVGSYDKTHCQTHDRKFTPGRHLAVFHGDFGPFGILICADRRWPEAVRSLAVQGARVIFNPTYGMADDMNLAMMRTRSFESEVFIAFTHPRQSLLTGPGGRVHCDQREPRPAFARTTIDLAEADAARATPSAHLRDRRTDLYQL